MRNLKLIGYARFSLLTFGLMWMFSCKSPIANEGLKPERIYADTVFKESKVKDLDFQVLQVNPQDQVAEKNQGSPEVFKLSLNGRPLGIQREGAGGAALSTDFSFAGFINSQHTAILVQLHDQSGLVAPFYIVSLQAGAVKAYSLYRNSSAEGNVKFAKGKTDIGRSGYLINNDFLVTRVDGRVFFIKRQFPEQRIQGLHILNSKDKQTLVFLINSTLYQVHYPSGKRNSLVLPADVPLKPVALFAWIQQNLSWDKDQKNISFLKPMAADNRVRNLNEFK